MVALNFDANDCHRTHPLEPLAAGQYVAEIIGTEMKTTKSGVGRYLQITFEIAEGDCQGRILWARLNLENPQPQIVRMARATLSSICHAVGILNPIDSQQLHGKRLLLQVSQKVRRDGEIENQIRQYVAWNPASSAG